MKATRILLILILLCGSGFGMSRYIIAKAETTLLQTVSQIQLPENLSERLRAVETRVDKNSDRLEEIRGLLIERRLTRVETLIEWLLWLASASFLGMCGLILERAKAIFSKPGVQNA